MAINRLSLFGQQLLRQRRLCHFWLGNAERTRENGSDGLRGDGVVAAAWDYVRAVNEERNVRVIFVRRAVRRSSPGYGSMN